MWDNDKERAFDEAVDEIDRNGRRKMYVSRRYLREKWEALKWDMQKVLNIYEAEGDNAAEDAERVASEMADLMDAIKKELGVPTVEPKHGRWIKRNEWQTKTYKRLCSNCGEVAYFCGAGNYPYCPNCGARMDEVSDATAETYEATFGDGSPITYTED